MAIPHANSFTTDPRNLGEVIEIESHDSPQDAAQAVKYKEVKNEFGSIKSENLSLEVITSSTKLHPFLKESLKYFNSRSPDAYSRLKPGRTPCVDIWFLKNLLKERSC